MLRRIARRLPTADWLLNHVVARIPYANARMRAYARFGVNVGDPTRTLLMLNSEIIEPHRLWLEEGAVVGKHCVLDARGTLRICPNPNVSGGVRLLTGSHDVNSASFDAYYEPVTVGERAWIATGSIVLPGVTIGESGAWGG